MTINIAASEAYGLFDDSLAGAAQPVPRFWKAAASPPVSEMLSSGRGLPVRHLAVQFPLFYAVEDLFEDCLEPFIPRNPNPLLLLGCLVVVCGLDQTRFRTFAPIVFPEHFEALCIYHGVFKNYWRGIL